MSAIQKDLFSAKEFKEINKGKRKKSDKKEERIQLQVCNYLKKQYPGVVFFCDMASGLHLPIWLGVLHKKMRSSRGIPDLFIAHPKYAGELIVPCDALSYGLFIELKADGTRRKDGTIPPRKKKEKVGGVLVEVDHHAEQAVVMHKLQRCMYTAEFACGFDEAKKIIDEYLN